MGLLRRLFGTKKQPGNSDGSVARPPSQKRRWSFVKSSKESSQLTPPFSSHFNGLNSPSTSSGVFSDSLDANKHAIAVAAATAAVAEAALAAAHAAAEVVRLTNGTCGVRAASSAHGSNSQRMLVEIIAAVKIQSAFRGYLARRALRALKALVKLQALVKGHIVRKQTADMFRRMQTLVRLQSRLCANRMHMAGTSHSSMSSLSHFPNEDWEHSYRGYVNKLERPPILKRCSSNSSFREIDSAGVQFNKTWLEHWMEENLWTNRCDASLKACNAEDYKNDKILEVDTGKPHLNSQLYDKSSHSSLHGLDSDYNCANFAYYNSPSKSLIKRINPSVSSMEVPPLSQHFPKGKEDAASWTAENIPAFSASSRPGGVARRTPSSPTKSECSYGFFNSYSGYPNYMANTESSRAKVRSLSAPRQRLEFERYGSTRMSLQGSWDSGIISDRDADFRNKAFSTSSHLNKRPGSTNFRRS